MQQSPPEIHTPISNEEIIKTFDEVETKIELSSYGIEDWVTLTIFWIMCGCVFVQFFTRYVLNNSFGWTEEIASYCLVAVVFLGSVMCVRLSKHIHVDFLYRYVGGSGGRALSTFVDIVRIAAFAYLTVLVWRYAEVIHDEQMTTINFPKRPVFMLVCAAFALMTLRGIQVAIGNWLRGYSVLEKPAAFDAPSGD